MGNTRTDIFCRCWQHLKRRKGKKGSQNEVPTEIKERLERIKRRAQKRREETKKAQ